MPTPRYRPHRRLPALYLLAMLAGGAPHRLHVYQ